MLALGVVPVGVGDFLGGYEWRERPWAQDALGGAEPEVVGGQEINFEAVAAQRPDLIIAINAGLKQGDYDRLSQIAPTVAQSGDYIDFGMPWDEQTLLVGRALGREERAREVVADVEAKFARVRATSTRSSPARRRSSPTAARTATAPTRPRTRAAASSPTSASRRRSAVDELAGDALLRRVQPGAVPAHGPGRRRHVRRAETTSSPTRSSSASTPSRRTA